MRYELGKGDGFQLKIIAFFYMFFETYHLQMLGVLYKIGYLCTYITSKNHLFCIYETYPIYAENRSI